MDFSDIVQPPGQPKPYWQTLDEYRKAAANDPTIAKMSLPEYASGINQLVGYPEHQENIQDSGLRRLGANISIGMHHFGGATAGDPYTKTGLPSLSEMFGGPREGVDLPAAAHRGAAHLATQMGASPEVSEAVGTGGEQLVGSLPVAAAGLLPGVGIPAMAGMAGLETYGETGSKAQATVSGAGAALIPKFMEGAGQAALRAVGAKTLGELSPELANLLPKDTAETAAKLGKFVPSNLAQRGLEFGAKQAGLTANMLGTGTVETAVDPNLSWEDKLKQVGSEFSPSNLIATAVGQLPFTGMDLIKARTAPLEVERQNIRAEASDKVAGAYKEFTGINPTAKEVEEIVKSAETGKPVAPDSIKGKVLASLQIPNLSDLEMKLPIKTSEGEWQPLEAVETTRNKANDMLVAQGLADPDRPPISIAHDQTLSYVLRNEAEKSGHTLNKDDLSHVAASQVADMWAGDREDLKQSGYVPEGEFPPFGYGTTPEKRFESYQKQAGVDERIALQIDPNVPQYYDQNLHQRMALFEGDPETWGEAGIPEDLKAQVWEALQQETAKVAPELQVTKGQMTDKPFLSNIVDRISGLGQKASARIAAIERQIQQEIAQHGIFGEAFGGRGELERLYAELKDAEALGARERGGMQTTTKSGSSKITGAPSGDATFAGRKAALDFQGFDINDPASVRKFVNVVSEAVRTAEKGFNRRRLTYETLKGPDGESLRPSTKEEAEKLARIADKERNKEEQFNVQHSVTGPEKDGTYRVVKTTYASVFGWPENKGEDRSGEAGQGDVGERLAATEPEETTEKPLVEDSGVPEGTTLDELAHNLFEQGLDEISKHNDPAVRAGRKAALARNFADMLQVIPDAKWREIYKGSVGKRIQDLDKLKKTFIRYVQFLSRGGDVTIKKDGQRLTGVGNLDELNKFMGELGYGKYEAPHSQAGEEQSHNWNRRFSGTPNFFEKFAIFSQQVSRFLVDPRTMLPNAEYRPLGDYGWQTPEFRRDLDKKVTINWPENTKQDLKQFTHIKPGILNRDGSEYRSDLAGIGSKTGMIKNQSGHLLADTLLQIAKHDLVIKAKDLTKWFKQLGGVDTSLAEQLFKELPFVANQNVGVGMTRDSLNKGYFHYDDPLSSAGVLIDPFEFKNLKLNLQQPQEIFDTLMEELGHSATHFAWNTDAKFQADVQRVYDKVKSHLDAMVGVGADGGKFAQLGITSLRSPQEMLAGMFRDPGLHEFLKGIDDPEPFYQSGVSRSFFDTLYNMIKNLYTKLFGPVGAQTMLSRVASLTSRAVEIQKGLKLVNRGDIYQYLYDNGHLEMAEPKTPDVLKTRQPEPVPKAQEPTQVFPPRQPELLNQRRDLQKQLDEAQTTLTAAMQQFEKGKDQPGWQEQVAQYANRVNELKAALERVGEEGQTKATTYVAPQRAGKLPKDLKPVKEMLMEDVEQARTNLSYVRQDPSSAHGGDLKIAEERLRQAFDRLEAYDKGELGVEELVQPQTIKDVESKLADLRTQLDATNNLHIAATNETEVQQRVTSERLKGAIQSNEKLLEQLIKISKLKKGQRLSDTGEVLESRVAPERVIDAMKAASTYLTEDHANDLWFKPYNIDYFRRVFGPAFGDKLKLTNVGGQWGYSVRPSEAFNLTEADVARMPVPRPKSWAPTIFETAKSLFKQQGASDDVAEAQAGYVMRYASLLKNTEHVIWGELPSQSTGEDAVLGQAWGYWKHAGLMPESVQSDFAPTEHWVRHESAHVSGFHEMYKREPRDVRMAMHDVNTAFNRLTENQRRILISDLNNLTNFDFKAKGNVYEASITSPIEFAGEVMGHIGDVITQVPDPSVYLKDAMRFAPDDVSRMVQLSTLRRTQAMQSLKSMLEQQLYTRGVKNSISSVVDDVVDVFKGMSRSALEIAEDISEFYRTRFVYPDTYKGLLEQYMATQAEFAQTGPVGEVTPKLGGHLLESRIPPPIENAIRKFFNYPTSDGNLPAKLSLWDKNLMQFAQFAMKYQSARSFFDMFFTSRADREKFRLKAQTALAGAMEGNKVMDDLRTKHVSQFLKSPSLRNKLSQMALETDVTGDFRYDQEKKRAGGDEFNMDPTAVSFMTPEYLRSLMDKHGVTDAERPIIQTVWDGLRNQYAFTGQMIVGAHEHEMNTLIAMGVARATDLMPEGARKVALALTQAVKTQTTDPQGAAKALFEFQQAVKDPNKQTQLLDMAQGAWRDIQRLQMSFDMRSPHYFSEMRPGKYGLVWKDAQGKPQNRYFTSDKERRDYVTRNKITPQRQTDPDGRGVGLNPNLMSMIDEIHQRTVERMTNLFGEQDAKQAGQLIDFSTELRDELNRNDLLKETLGRKLQPGRDELDMFDTTQHYLNAASNAIMKRFVKRESELLFTSPEFNNQPEVKSYIQRQIEAFMKPDTPTGSMLRNLGFFYYLWGNISSMFMQTSHQVMGLAPMMTRQGQSVANSFGLIAKANKLVMEARRGGYKDPVIGEMVDRLEKDVGVSSWISRETEYNKDLSLMNRIRGTAGKPLWGPFDLVKNKLYQGFDIGRQMYDIIPNYNSKVAFVASLLHLRSDAYAKLNGKTLSGDELYKEAVFLRANAMPTGGKENRPGFFHWAPRSAAQGIWSLQSYANALTTEMGELIRRSFNPTGMTPAQTRQVRKAAVQMLITQTAVAGVMGLPFATLALTAIQKLFPDHNIEADIREVLAGLGGDDEAMGSLISNAAVTGIPSALDYSPDLGSRFALHGVFHVSPYGDMGWEQLFGPAGGIMTNVLKGAQAGLEGRPVETVQSLMPVGFRRIWQGLEQGKNYKTGSGRLVTDDLRPEEIVARMVGFRPARVRRIEDFERLSKATENAEKEEQAAWTKKQVGLLATGKDAEVRQNLAQRVVDKKTYPANKYATDIAEEYERSTMPVDLKKFGNRATVLAQKSLQGALGTQTEGPSNVQRLQLQQQIATRLGLGAPSQSRWRHASGVDMLLQRYPHLTTPQASLLLNRAAGSRPSADLYQELLTGGE